MRGGTKFAVAIGGFAAASTVVLYGVYTLVGDEADAGTQSASAPAPVKTGPPDAAEVTDASTAFFQAWAAGDAEKTAQLTNNAADAVTALTGYASDAHITKVVVTPGTPVDAKVPYSVTATVSFDDKTTEWTYDTSLTVTRGLSTGRALVEWQPAVLYPGLKTGESLKTGEAAAPQIEALDHNGVELTKEKYPSLGTILDALRERYGKESGGQAGIETWVASSDEAIPDRTVNVITEGTPGKLTTTLDATAQAAAEKAVAGFENASVVAIKPSTGEIRAVANNRTDSFNAAMQGAKAPGSTLKIVSSALLIDQGIVAADKKADCPKSSIWYGRTFTNLNDFSIDGGTFQQSFARSCNTAFISHVDEIEDDSLHKEAEDVFGIGLDWKAGISTFDGSIPVSTEAATAAALIGQGQVQMNPLNMASIAATAKAGTFHQPIIVPQSLDNRALAQAARSLSADTASQLRQMMRLTATSGTAATAMANVGGDKGAKTGSAEVDGQENSDSWFVGYSDDLAAAALVEKGGHGGDAAGPIVAEVLRAG